MASFNILYRKAILFLALVSLPTMIPVSIEATSLGKLLLSLPDDSLKLLQATRRRALMLQRAGQPTPRELGETWELVQDNLKLLRRLHPNVKQFSLPEPGIIISDDAVAIQAYAIGSRVGVHSVAFRFDSRDPLQVLNQGGFFPNLRQWNMLKGDAQPGDILTHVGGGSSTWVSTSATSTALRPSSCLLFPIRASSLFVVLEGTKIQKLNLDPG